MHVRPLVAGLLATAAVLGLTGASASAASIPHSVLYTSTAPGVGNIPSVGVEAYSFNQIGDEVMLRRVAKIKSVAVQLSSWACQTGAWNTGDCHTNAGATFTTPITLNLYRAIVHRSTTGETTPGALIATVTRTFTIPYRPSASSHCIGAEAGEWFKNGPGLLQRSRAHDRLHAHRPEDEAAQGRGLGRLVQLRQLRAGADRRHERPRGLPERRPRPEVVRAGHQRFPGGIFWDTRFAGFSCGPPFVTGDFNLDNAAALLGRVRSRRPVQRDQLAQHRRVALRSVTGRGATAAPPGTAGRSGSGSRCSRGWRRRARSGRR